MITYITLPKGKRFTASSKLISLREKFKQFRNKQLKKRSRLILWSTATFLILVSLVSVVVATANKGHSSFFRGVPHINSLSAREVIPSGLVEIRGRNFGVIKSSTPTLLPGSVVFTGINEPSVSPEGVEALVLSWTDDKVTVFVPTEAKSGLVYIINREDKETLQYSNGQLLNIIPTHPQIDSLSTSQSTPSKVIAIKGKNFGNFMAGAANFPSTRQPTFPGRVVFSNSKTEVGVDVLSWQDDKIQIYTPSALASGDLKVILQIGAEEVESGKIPLEVAKPNPKVASLSKDTGLPSEEMVITGSNFGQSQTNPLGLLKFPGHVFIGKADSLIESWSEKQITVYIPTGARVGKQDITVSLDYLNDSQTSNLLSFNLGTPNPEVTAAPAEAFPSEVVTISGDNFGNQISSNRFGVIFPGRVFFSPSDSVEPDRSSNIAPILSWSNSSIQVDVPVGVRKGKVFVARSTCSSDFFSKGTTFNPKVPNPQIEKLSTTQAQPGDIVEIYGTHLGNQMGTNRTAISYPGRVTVAGKVALPVLNAWGDAKISVFLPWGVKSGPISVQLQDGNRPVVSNQMQISITEAKPQIDKVTILDPEENLVTIRGRDLGNQISNPYVGSYYPGHVFLSREEKASGTNQQVLGASRLEAKVKSWQDDKIILKLPKGKTSGYFYVTVDSANGSTISNPLSYPKN